MGDGIGRTLRRAAILVVLFPIATIAASWAADRSFADDGLAALHWIVPVMSACAVAMATLGGDASPARRMLAWLAGTLAGSALSAAMLWTPWGVAAGAILAGLQLWQVAGVAAAIAVARIVAAPPRPPFGRVALLVPLLPVTTLVTLVFVAMLHDDDRPALGTDFPAWTVTVVSAAAATAAILADGGGFAERVVAWLASTVAAAAVTFALHGPVVALFAGAPAAAGPLDPAILAVTLWQGLGPALGLAFAALALAAWAPGRQRALYGGARR